VACGFIFSIDSSTAIELLLAMVEV